MHISSTANQRVRDIRKLRLRKERDQNGTFFLEGIRIVAEALAQKAEVDELIYAAELLSSDYALSLVDQFRTQGGLVLEVTADVFNSIAQKENPQGLAAVAAQRWIDLDSVTPENDDIWVVLDTVRDPGNLGTILRTLDGVGGCGVILLDDSCDPYDPTAIRASMGAIFTQQLVKSSLTDFQTWRQSRQVGVVGTSDHEGRLHYREYHYPKPVVLMMGSERAGLSADHIHTCDAMVMVPMVGFCDSLNLSVATGIVLYEIFDQYHNRAG